MGNFFLPHSHSKLAMRSTYVTCMSHVYSLQIRGLDAAKRPIIGRFAVFNQ